MVGRFVFSILILILFLNKAYADKVFDRQYDCTVKSVSTLNYYSGFIPSSSNINKIFTVIESDGKVTLSDKELFPTNKLKVTSAGTGAVYADAFQTSMNINIKQNSFVYTNSFIWDVNTVFARCKKT